MLAPSAKIGECDIKTVDTPSLPETPPGFPVEVFPAKIQDYIRECEEVLQFDPDFTAAVVLAAVSGAMGNCIHIDINGNYSEPGMLWLLFIGDPATKKTPVSMEVLGPFVDRENCYYDDYLSATKEYERNKAGEGGDAETMAKPTRKRCSVDNYTFESLVQTLEENPRGVIQDVDEALAYYENLNRYNKGNDQAAYNGIWSQKVLNLDRKTATSHRVPKPYLAFIGNIQPYVLDHFLPKRSMHDGRFHRYLFVKKNTPATKKCDKVFRSDIRSGWREIINTLLDIDYTGQPRRIPFSAAAWDHYLEWNATYVDMINATADPILKGVLGKYDSQLVRIILNLQVMHDACEGRDTVEISAEQVANGIKVLDFFYAHAVSVLELLDLLERQPDQRKAWIETMSDLLPEEFQTCDALDLIKKLGKSERSIKEALKNRMFFERKAHGQYRKAT